MSNRQPDVAREYARAVLRRAREPLEPRGWAPDWADRPSQYKTYLDAVRLPLPDAALPTVPVAELDRWPTVEGEYTVERVASMLRASYGVMSWRLRITWNHEPGRTRYPQSTWSRGTASGGGLYPLEIYWVSGPSGPLLPGIYQYATGQHSLVRLLAGDVTDRVRAATGYHLDTCATDQFLVVSVAFWRNTFKYGSLGYHLVTQDLGALLGSWELLARAMGAPLRRLLWFNDRTLNELLGLDPRHESVFAVVPLPWRGDAETPPASSSTSGSRVDRPVYERSRSMVRFPMTERVHLASLVTEQNRPVPPAPLATRTATGPAIPLDRPTRLEMGVDAALRSRRSAFGMFAADPALSLDELGHVLAFASAGRRYRTDVKPANGDRAFTRLSIVANRVTGLPSGCYAYDDRRHALLPVGQQTSSLQRHYLLDNYDLDRVGAVVAISGQLESMLAAFGNRGYRILNAEVGAVAQSGCVAAAAAGIGCGTVLGMDHVAMDELLGFGGTDEHGLLFLLLGRPPAAPADMDYRLTAVREAGPL
jgi:SagB-type dehydrogenase family enzyme